jgi:hypothetical protein
MEKSELIRARQVGEDIVRDLDLPPPPSALSQRHRPGFRKAQRRPKAEEFELPPNVCHSRSLR